MENERFLMTNTKFSDSHGYWYEIDYQYDRAGHLIRELKEESSGEKTEKRALYEGELLLELVTETENNWDKVFFRYDENGMLVNERQERADGGWYEKSWKDEGETCIELFRDSDGYESTLKVTAYPEQNRELEIFEDSEGKYRETERSFNEHRLTTALKSRDREGKVTNLEQYDFDGSGNLVHQKSADELGRYESFSEYDDEGCILNVKTLAGDGSESLSTWEYQNGLCVEEVRLSSYEKEVTEYIYDEEGREVRQLTESWTDYDEQGMANAEYNSSAIEYSYDSKGEPIKVVRTNSEGEEAVDETEYDDYGNIVAFKSVYFDGTVYNYSYTFEEQE